MVPGRVSVMQLKQIIAVVTAPLLSLFIFILGSGLFTTLLTVRLHHEGVSELYIGALTGLYYTGLGIGGFKIENYIIRVGHIRSFAVFASLLASLTFLQGIWVNQWAWLLLRFVEGFCTGGIFIVVESWLLAKGSLKHRGQILAIYMLTFYAGQALGQFFINLGHVQTLFLFAFTAMLYSLSVIPIALTKNPSPEIHTPSSLNFTTLFKKSGSGLISALCAGLILGSIYGLFPLVVMQKTGMTAHVAGSMAIIIFGGMALQYPVGRLSDIIERRTVLLALALMTILLAFFLMSFFHQPWLAYGLMFIFGGMTFTIYPVSISHACDTLTHDEIVSGTQGVLLSYSIGAATGPFLTPIFMKFLGTNGFFIAIICVCITLSIFLVWRKIFTPSQPSEDNFIVMPRTSPITAEMDPRGQTD